MHLNHQLAVIIRIGIMYLNAIYQEGIYRSSLKCINEAVEQNVQICI